MRLGRKKHTKEIVHVSLVHPCILALRPQDFGTGSASIMRSFVKSKMSPGRALKADVP